MKNPGIDVGIDEVGRYPTIHEKILMIDLYNQLQLSMMMLSEFAGMSEQQTIIHAEGTLTHT